MTTNLLDIETLSVALRTRAGRLQALDGVDLAIAPGETVCLVGESGSGKTITALSALRLIDFKGGRITGGAIRFDGKDIAALSQRRMSALRGRRIGIIFQEPMTAFDPLFTIGAQIIEVIQRHTDAGPAKARRKAVTLLERVHIGEPERRIDQYPHELSGGMQQRAMIAMALACEPALLVADEPTTALDVTIQAQILQLLKDIQTETGLAILFITHDLGVAARIADRVVVLYAGRVVEDAPAETIFARPAHPYTRGLLDSIVTSATVPGSRLPAMEGAIPDLADMPSGCRFHPRCARATVECQLAAPPLERCDAGHVACWHPHDERWRQAAAASPIAAGPRLVIAPRPATLIQGTDLRKHYGGPLRWLSRQPPMRAVDGVGLTIAEGETLGLVGESGSGKSTLGRLLLHMEEPTTGKVEFRGHDLAGLTARELRAARRDMQMIFQDPYGSLDPRWTIGALVAEPLVIHGIGSPQERRDRVRNLLEQVGLDPRWDDRYAHQLSGGQRQRVAIARAIATDPRFIVADEAVSALDVSLRAQIINLLQDLGDRLSLAYLFIGHDLNVVRHVSDRIGVMYQGRLVEIGPGEHVFHRPAHPYTRALLDSIPDAGAPVRTVPAVVPGEMRSAAFDRGCRFQGRCPAASARCREEEPELRPVNGQHAAACHLLEAAA